MADNFFNLWTVYNKPRDYPDHYIARRWLLDNCMLVATQDIVKADTLEGVRALLPPGLYCLDRATGDDPVIVENWL